VLAAVDALSGLLFVGIQLIWLAVIWPAQECQPVCCERLVRMALSGGIVTDMLSSLPLNCGHAPSGVVL
jgi:hypothetical protein